MTAWQSDPTMTTPPSYTTTAEEAVTLSCDVAALLIEGDPPASPPPQARLWRLVEGGVDVEVTGLAATTVAGGVLSQRLPTLTAGAGYRLRWLFVTGGNTRAATTIVVCAP